MEKIMHTLAVVVALMLWPMLSSSQSIIVQSNIGGVVDYHVDAPVKGTHVFTILGNGEFSMQKQPTHLFAPLTGGYQTDAFLVKPYNTNPPGMVSTGTGTTGTGGIYKNGRPRMSGEIDILMSWCPAPNLENFFILAFTNLQSATPIDGCIDFHFHTNELLLNRTNIRIYNTWVTKQTLGPSKRANQNKRLSWEFKNLKYDERRYIYIPAEVLLGAGSQIDLFASYAVDCKSNDGGGSGSGASIDKFSRVQRYSHDPNGKSVQPGCLIENEPYQFLEYEITFFNDGNWFAHDVVIKDTLPMLLNPSTFELIDSEYAPAISIDGQVLTFTFDNIMLPGELQDTLNPYSPEDISSYVKFGICTRPPITSQTCIENQASIYFDANPAVVTPIASACVWPECTDFVLCDPPAQPKLDPSEIQPEGKTGLLKVWPNPFKDEFSFVLDEAPSSISEVQIIDFTGRIRHRQAHDSSTDLAFQQKIQLENLPAGIYFVLVLIDGERHLEKIVKY